MASPIQRLWMTLRRYQSLVVVALIATALSLLAFRWLGYDFTYFDSSPIGGPTQQDVWIERWNLYQALENLLHRPTDLGYATIFAGEPSPMALSIGSYGQAVQTLPVYLLTSGNIDITYNLYYIATFVLSAVGMFVLIRYLLPLIPPWLVVIGALMFAFGEYRFLRWAHLSLLSTHVLVFWFYTFHRFLDRATIGHALVMALAFWLLFFSSGYYGYMSLVAGVLILIYVAIKKPQVLTPAFFRSLIAAVGVFAVLALPFILFRFGNPLFFQGHDAAQVYGNSSEPLEWFSSHSLIYMNLVPYSGENTIFLGFVPLLLAAGAWRWRRQNTTEPEARLLNAAEVVGLYLLIGLMGYLFTLGPALQVNGQAVMPLPYAALMQLPGASSVRFMGRYIVLALLATSVLAPFALNVMHQRIKPAAFWPLLLLILGFLFVELIPFNGSYDRNLRQAAQLPQENRLFQTMLVPTNPGINQWLREQPAGTRMLHYPTGNREGRVLDFYYYADTALHSQPMFNGDGSTMVPGWYYSFDWANFPDADMISRLEARGMRYLIVHRRYLPLADGEAFDARMATYFASANPNLRLVETFEDVQVYEVANPMEPQASPGNQ